MTNNNEDNLLPEASPRSIGTRRVNNNPLFIMIAIVTVFLLVIVYVATQKTSSSNDIQEDSNKIVSNSNVFAHELTSKYTTGIVPLDTPVLESLSPSKNDITPINDIPLEKDIKLSNTNENLTLPVYPSNYDFSDNKKNIDPERERIEMTKMQLFEQSLRSKTGIDNITSSSLGTSSYNSGVQSREQMINKIAAVREKIKASNTGNLTEAYKQRLEMIKNSGFIESGTTNELSGTDQKRTFEQNNWQLENKVEIPSSPYLLRTGFIIPGTLISGMNSELPGNIIAQVSQNVYDTATGKYLLIPQGSRLNGTYNSDVVFGQARIMVAWHRIIFPDGKTLDLGSMPGTDSAGYTGLTDRINNHYLRIFGSAVLLSGVTAGISYSQDNHNDDKSMSGAMSEALGQQLGQTTMQLINKNMNIAPTLEIRQGYRFNIIVAKDIVFPKPYKSFDY